MARKGLGAQIRDPIRVLVAEDDPVLRSALAEMIRSEPTLELVAVAADAEQAIELTQRHDPRVVLLDVKMPMGGGPRAAREIGRLRPDIAVVSLSAYGDVESVHAMLSAGSLGYLLKGASVDEIVEAIHRAARGMVSLTGDVAAGVVGELTGQRERAERGAERQRRLIERTRRALEPGGVQPVFQPIVDLSTGLVVGYEALARFPEAPGSSPDRWFAEAAEAGLLVELEVAAIRAALAEFDAKDGLYVAFNLSPASVVSNLFTDALAGLDPERTVLEVTEHAQIGDYKLLAERLRAFRAAGGRLAVDDAGAGFASLRHILLLHPDVIKLDVSLTSGIDADRAKRAMAAALISFATEMGMTMLAEGVETERELEALRGLGVRFGQGFYLGRPGPLPTAP